MHHFSKKKERERTKCTLTRANYINLRLKPMAPTVMKNAQSQAAVVAVDASTVWSVMLQFKGPQSTPVCSWM
jgi:hypothetical protein